MSGIPTNRANITLPAEVSEEILAKTQNESAIMRLSQQTELPGRGKQISVISADPQAGWVAETDPKPVSNPTLGSKLMQAYQLAVIVPFSNQFRRDLPALYDELIRRLPRALATKFDQTVIGAVDKPGENFDNFALCTAQSIIPSGGHTTYLGLLEAYKDISDHGGVLDGFAMSPNGIGILLGAVDSVGRPIFIPTANDGEINRVLGRRTIEARGMYKSGAAAVDSTPAVPAIVGVAGDWTQAMWGAVSNVDISFSDQATLTINSNLINLWERNMFAVRAEIELGFRADTSCFNLLTGVAPSA